MKGSYVALVTPFKNNEIDYTALEKLIDFHLTEKTDGIVLLGTTAETPTLASDEKEALLRFCIHRLKGKMPIIVGTGSNNLNITISSTLKAEKAGAEYALIVTPYYNKPTQEGLYLYFKEIVKNTTIPIILYNVPGRTGCNLSAETTIRLANEYPERIIAVKEASANLVQASLIIKNTPESFTLLSGEDALNLPLMSVGAKGTISVTANIVPGKMHDMIQLALEGKYNEALKIHQSLIELNDVMFIESNPIPVKEALALMGFIAPELRLPLCNISENNKNKLIKILKDSQLI